MTKRDVTLLVACGVLVVSVITSVAAFGWGGRQVAGPAASTSASPALGPNTSTSPEPQDTDSPVPVVTAQPSPLPGPLLIQGDPGALPGNLLISDRGNSRVIELDARGNIVWQFPPPGYKGPIPFSQNDDAFFSPDRQQISTNEEFEHTIQVIDVKSRRVSWYFGTPFQAGSGPNHLNGPDDAYLLRDGRVMTADIKNCRILFISPNKQTSQLGHTGVCRHDPARGYFASPNGDAPSPDYQHVVITEIGGSWVDVFTLPDLHFEYSFRSPAQYSSDAIMQADGTFLISDYIALGAVYRVDRQGNVLWKYDRGLDHPSIAIGLPNGKICISDDYGDRVLIVDPTTRAIVWQYGQKNVPGHTAGHLYIPDGLDFRPSPDFRQPHPVGYF